MCEMDLLHRPTFQAATRETCMMIRLIAFTLCILFLVLRYVRLSSIPGPFLAKFTDLWRWIVQNRFAYDTVLVELHRKYGKIVRIGPSMVSISDPEAIAQVYGVNPPLEKGPSYSVTVGVSNGKLVQNLLSVDNAQHAKIVKAIGSSFTPSAVLDFEDAIDESAKQLVSALFKGGEKPVDLHRWTRLFAMDVLNRIAFGESPGYLEQGSDVNGFIQASEKRNEYWYTHSAIPTIDYIINKSPLAQLMRGTPSSLLGGIAMRKFKERRVLGDSEKANDLLQKYMEAQSRYPDDITDSHVAGLIATSIAAGADTVATTLAATLLLVLQNPGVRAKLEEEFATLKNISEPPAWSEVGSLPYMDATFKETMRYFPPAAFSMDRVVPLGGMTMAGTHLPAGTVVFCHNDTIHRDPQIFGPDADVFRPERWLESDEEQLRQMNRASIWFGHGKRICLGRHLAMVEMKKVMPLILRSFKMNIEPSQFNKNIREGVNLSAVRYLRPIRVSMERR